MMDIFYTSGKFKKKKFVTYNMGVFAGQNMYNKLWFGDWEPEHVPPPRTKTKLPDKFKPKPAYRGAK